MAVNYSVASFNEILDEAIRERRALTTWGESRLRRIDSAITRLDRGREIGFLARSDGPGPRLVEVFGQDIGGLLNLLNGARRPVVLVGPLPEDLDDDFYPRTEVEPGIWKFSDPRGSGVVWLVDASSDPRRRTLAQMATAVSGLLAETPGVPVVLSSTPPCADLEGAISVLRPSGSPDEVVSDTGRALAKLQDLVGYGRATLASGVLSFADTQAFQREGILEAAATVAAELRVAPLEAVVQVQYMTGPKADAMLGPYRKMRATLIPVPGTAGERLYEPAVIERLNALEEKRRLTAWRDIVQSEGLTWVENEPRDMVQREIVESPWMAVPGAITTAPGPGYTLLQERTLERLTVSTLRSEE